MQIRVLFNPLCVDSARAFWASFCYNYMRGSKRQIYNVVGRLTLDFQRTRERERERERGGERNGRWEEEREGMWTQQRYSVLVTVRSRLVGGLAPTL